MDVQAPAGPEIDDWEETLDGSACRHPAVAASCTEGWCRIPAGCFIMGSPESEFGRGRYTERLTGVTLTRSFEIGQHEVTQRRWSEVVGANPVRSENEPADATHCCIEPECPVTHVTWFEALHFANLLSEKHAPPLAPCFRLSGCQGEAGRGMTCTNVEVTAPTVYDCEGYRLPTEAEWEYAARAGTRTAFYSGDITVTVHGDPDPNLDPIAWYAGNATSNGKARTRPVGTRRPNRWMLYDVLGNASEWTMDPPTFQDPPGPLTDPTSAPESETRVQKGGRVLEWPDWLRAAGFDYPPAATPGHGYGFRLVRTLR